MSIERFDAIVVGGGPAGSLTALLLVRLGWRVALIERRERYRSKTCGHCLNPRINALLRRHGLFHDITQLACGYTQQVRVHVPERAPVTMRHVASHGTGDRHEPGLLLNRALLDQFLIDQAQAEGVFIHQPARAIKYDRQHTSITIQINTTDERETRQLQAPLVIGDGLRSCVARNTGLADHAVIGRCFGFSFHVTDGQSTALSKQTMEMFITPGGYLGVVHQRNKTLHVGGLIPNRKTTAAQRNPFEYVQQVATMFDVLRNTPLRDVAQGSCDAFCAVGPMPWRPRHVANAHVALVGDAAGYVEPFTGEGMAWAMESAELFVRTVKDRKPGTWNAATARAYEHRWRRRIGARQRYCNLVAAALRRPCLLRTVFRANGACEWLARPIVKQVLRPCPA